MFLLPATLKLLVFCTLGVVVAGNRNLRQSIGNTAAPGSSSVSPTVHSASSSKEHDSHAKSKESKDMWYGKEANVEDVEGCQWPLDFESRFSFCANRTHVGASFGIELVGGAEFGILDKHIAARLLEKCSSGDCSDAKINRTSLIDRAELWWHHMDNITDFSKCLKKNTEGMVRLCSASDEVSQTVSGIAGLHLSIMEVLNTAHKRVKEGQNHTEACLAKVSEAVHFTGALYLMSRFYAKNTVQCWDVTKGICSPTCKQFAYVLACLESVCPFSPADFAHSSIWEWYFTDAEKAKKTCDVQTDKAQCQSESAVISNKGPTPTQTSDILGKSKAVLDKVKEKFHEFEHSVEGYTHLKFYQVALIAGGSLALFIGAVTLLCMWYNGLLCQRRARRVLRYAKLIPEDRMGRKMDETKSLTRDYDDVE